MKLFLNSTRIVSILFLAIALQSCGDEMFPGQSQGLQAQGQGVLSQEGQCKLMADTMAKANQIERDRRNKSDFDCKYPEIPGHSLGPNPKCAGVPGYQPETKSLQSQMPNCS